MRQQHAGLSPERWTRFTLDQQILMIGNEMNRGLHVMDSAASLRLCYERVLRLTDLTIEVNERQSLRRELLLWRDLIAALHVSPVPDPENHRAAFRSLLLLTPEAARQIPYLLG